MASWGIVLCWLETMETCCANCSVSAERFPIRENGDGNTSTSNILTHMVPSYIDLTFPSELVLWIDPHCVSYRMGDFGQVVTVWENKAALESEAVQIPHFFKASHRTRSPSATFSRPQSQTPPPPPSASQSQSQTPPPPSNAMHHPHYQYQKAVMAN